MTLTFETHWGVAPNQHDTDFGTANRSSRTLGVDSNVTGKDDGISFTQEDSTQLIALKTAAAEPQRAFSLRSPEYME